MIDEDEPIVATNPVAIRDWEYERIFFLTDVTLKAFERGDDAAWHLNEAIALWEKIVNKA